MKDKRTLEREIRWLLQDKYEGKKTAEFYKDLQKLKAGTPVDYLIGWKSFLDCKIDLSQHPFIPRQETEFWVGKVINRVRGSRVPGSGSGMTRVLDIFAGSGCIGVAVLKHLPNSRVTFIDSEETCLEQVQVNLKLNQILPRRYHLVHADIFSVYPGYKLRFTDYDVILANPPYVALADKLPPSVKNHEPRLALYAGSNGMKIIKPFLAEAKSYLADGGQVFMEYDPRQKSAIEALVEQSGYTGWRFRRDQFGKWRWLEAA